MIIRRALQGQRKAVSKVNIRHRCPVFIGGEQAETRRPDMRDESGAKSGRVEVSQDIRADGHGHASGRTAAAEECRRGGDHIDVSTCHSTPEIRTANDSRAAAAASAGQRADLQLGRARARCQCDVGGSAGERQRAGLLQHGSGTAN